MTRPNAARTPVRTLGLVLFVAVAVSLAGCSSSSSGPATTTSVKLSGFAAQPATTILADACAATFGARSIAATTTYGVPAQVGNVVSMHWVLTVGTNAGTVLYLHHGAVHSVIMPTISYVKGNAAYWTNDASPPRPGAANLENTWLSVASSSANNALMGALISQASLQGVLANCVPSTLPVKGTLSMVGPTHVIAVKVPGGSTTQTFYVATSGTPYIIKTTVLGGASGNQTTYLTGFNQQKVPAAPSGAVSIDPLLAS